MSSRERASFENPFLRLLYRSLSGQFDVKWFDWKTALLGNWNLLHLHWPEQIFRPSRRGLSVPVKYAFAWLFLLRIWWTRPAIVWTVHNNEPHESGGLLERRFLALLAGFVDKRVYMAPDAARSSEHSVIPHGVYEQSIPSEPPTIVTGRILFAGLIRPYKGVEELIAAFGGLTTVDVSLRLVGKPHTPEYGRAIASLCNQDARASCSLRFLPDAQLVVEVLESEIVVLPYRRMGNSGVLFFALGLNRPVLAPRSPTTEWLQACVGTEFIYLYDGVLNHAILDSALAWARSERPSAPDLSQFQWTRIGDQYSDVFRCALDQSKARSRGPAE
ncbi:hypothetical protein [Agromyces indicus]|uniref:hypothetical protein n=1 Tax=Agromyces indicus TaxID=758919 RepID=UPI00286DD672|nr:hypothetical protein [Agromyces indicus]